MKYILACCCLLILFAACKKADRNAPVHVLAPCETNYGNGNANFTSQYYSLNRSYSLSKCEINFNLKEDMFHPERAFAYLEIVKDSFSVGIDSVMRFRYDSGSTFDDFDDHTPITIRKSQVKIFTNVNDPDCYGYVSNDEAGSFFVITAMSDTSIAGNYLIHVSRLRKYPTGINIDTSDHSVIQGSFQDLKIIQRASM